MASAASSFFSAVWTSALVVSIIWLVSTTEVPRGGEDASNSSLSLTVSACCSVRRAF